MILLCLTNVWNITASLNSSKAASTMPLRREGNSEREGRRRASIFPRASSISLAALSKSRRWTAYMAFLDALSTSLEFLISSSLVTSSSFIEALISSKSEMSRTSGEEASFSSAADKEEELEEPSFPPGESAGKEDEWVSSISIREERGLLLFLSWFPSPENTKVEGLLWCSRDPEGKTRSCPLVKAVNTKQTRIKPDPSN
mmetsp:Transcript_35714/g.70375  ORF Transcript_35714/g.70375 Transcript_35714/m.70375 type:complete len:201 (-) Transcript_35714:68-670(-)